MRIFRYGDTSSKFRNLAYDSRLDWFQICPIPSELADQAEACFRTEGQKTGIDYEEDSATALQAISGITDNYFRVDLPDGKTLVHLIKPGHPFNLQFGR